MAISATHKVLGIANGTFTRGIGAIATGGTVQQLFAANTERQYLLIQNPSNAGEILFVDFTSNASTTQGTCLELAPGAAISFEGSFCPTDKVTVNAATTGHKYVAYQG